MPSYDAIQTLIGTLYLVFSAKGLHAIRHERPRMKAGSAPSEIKRQLDAYFNGTLREFAVALAIIEGTEFERSVWESLRNIPYGETRSYKWLAERVGRPHAGRAVGQALSKNPVPIVLPCHRVIEADGGIGGYSGGVDIKIRLLELEYYRSL